MPITYHIDTEKGLIVETVTSTVTYEEAVAYNKRKLADPLFVKTFRGLLDLRGATLSFKEEEIDHFKQHYRENKEKIIPKQWAILCDSPLETAYVIILCEVWKEIGLTVRPFNDEQAAHDFLLL